MSEIVKLLLSLSLSGSILAVLVFAVKPFIKHKLSKSIQYYIWIVVLLRLTIPFSFETSIMNGIFYGSQTSVVETSQGKVQPTAQNSLLSVQENVANGVYNGDTDHGRYFQDLFNQYAIYIWLLGAIIALTVNLTGYVRFLKYLNDSNILANIRENEMLANLLNNPRNVKLARNRFINTPMLVGIVRPYIIIPDINFNDKQLKNILLHEITHLKRFDITIKWLTMIVSSIHWFNPLMYFIKKDINSSCELACDEAVIKNLSPSEKQDYGDTLISVVALNKYPTGILQVTMCEEKKGLKERLVAIMNYSRKSKKVIILSVILLGLLIFSALYLGAGVGPRKNTPLAYDLTEISKYKTPYLGDNSKVSIIVNALPTPYSYFKQQYISMATQQKPYKLNVFYEASKYASHSSEWPIVGHNNATYSNMSKNALVLFCMIDNLDEVTFAFRDSASDGKLDESKYDISFTITRVSIEEQYGDISALAGKLDLLQEALSRPEI